MLKVEKLNVGYGATQVLWDVGLEVNEGEIVALIGSNGAGKTTLLTAISGLLQSLSGGITFCDRLITRAPSDEIVAMGISHVPQGRRLFAGLTVKDNLLQGAYCRRDTRGVREDLGWVLSLFPVLKQRLDQVAGTLSGGEQQMCALGRGLMARPKLLMIDELSLGLAPIVVEHLLGTLSEINSQGTTILLVEQDVQVALEQANRGYVLETGRIVLSGAASNLLADQYVKTAYLGL